MNIIETMETVFTATFKRRGLLRKTDTWAVGKVFLRALFALPMDDAARAIYRKHTGREDTPAQPFAEAALIKGRRGGGSIIAALIAVFLACFRDYGSILSPGETGIVMILSADRRMAQVIFGYIEGFLATPMLAAMAVSRTRESITLNNHIVIEIHTSSFRAVRGFTICCAICDEIAFWPSDDSANPDVEVLNALRPALASVPGSLLLILSSPYGKYGALYETYREHHGKPSAVLVFQGTSREMNPTLSAATVALAYARDPARARSEYGAEFRDDVSGFLSLEVVEALVVRDRVSLPPLPGVSYRSFVDPSGGRADAMAMSIGHVDGERAVLDLVVERIPPFSPEEVAAEFCEILRNYRVFEVVGDKYGASWVSEAFERRGVVYKASELSKSELFLEFLPMATSGQCELLDNRKLVNQLVGLERRTARGGRDSVDHRAGSGSHDDLANCVAGVCTLLAGSSQVYGLLDYLSAIDSGAIPMPDALPEPPKPSPFPVKQSHETRSVPARGITQRLPPSLTPETFPPCPKCSATCRVKLGGVGLRCNNCGHVDASGLPEPMRPPSRGDLLAGRFQSRTGRF